MSCVGGTHHTVDIADTHNAAVDVTGSNRPFGVIFTFLEIDVIHHLQGLDVVHLKPDYPGINLNPHFISCETDLLHTTLLLNIHFR